MRAYSLLATAKLKAEEPVAIDLDFMHVDADDVDRDCRARLQLTARPWLVVVIHVCRMRR